LLPMTPTPMTPTFNGSAVTTTASLMP